MALNDADRTFLREMVAHHRAAVKMAEGYRSRGVDARVLRLADGIIKAQTKEIADMTDWLGVADGPSSVSKRQAAQVVGRMKM